MGFADWFSGLFKRRKLSKEDENFMKKAEEIKPEKPLNYKNESEDLAGVTSEGVDL